MRIRGNSTYHVFKAPCRGTEASVIHIHYLYSQGAKPLIYTEGFMGGSIQKDRSDMYTGRTITHLYREDDPTSIQKELSHLYRQLRATVYRKVGPTLIQKKRSLIYTGGNNGRTYTGRT